MNKSEAHQAARAALPKVPEEVFSLWLDERIDVLGWNPLHPRWRGLLRNRPLVYWHNLNWQKLDIHLQVSQLNPECQGILSQLLAGLAGLPSIVTAITGNSHARVRNILQYMRANGTWPNSIILANEGTCYLVADGFHRLAAFSKIQCPGSGTFLRHYHSAWIGK